MATAEVDLITKVKVSFKRKFVDNGPDFYVQLKPKISTTVELEKGAKNKIDAACRKTMKERLDGKTIKAK